MVVTRKTPELLCPAEFTPHEFKSLSDIDDQTTLRLYVTAINFYKKNPSMEGKDLVKIIREAIAKALVFYYPLAGRLREHTGRKLVVECTGQGVVFAEADADVTLQHFEEDGLYPPFPNLDAITLDVPNNQGVLFDIPLMFIQDLSFPSVSITQCAMVSAFPNFCPPWVNLLAERRPLLFDQFGTDIFLAPPSRRACRAHREYDVATGTSGGAHVPLDQMVERSFLFGSAEISALRRILPPHLQRCSKFDIVAGCTWRCQTIALSPEPDEEIRFIGVMDNRKQIKPPLPVGYSGNVISLPVAVTTAGELSKNPLHYTVELVTKAKREATTDKYLRSVASLMVMRDRPNVTGMNTYMVSNMMHVSLNQMDVGWGTAAYGGVAKGILWPTVNMQIAWYHGYKDGFVVPVSLPLKSMKVFEKHLRVMITTAPTHSSL
ncbi:hypothetical protein SASPL_148050 [Salvia splendens]|uniref:Uncharacterized protein n=1 Tax=Salvia splendens TaxID=180675 RepID=A0A8X8W9C9_SALSN|nr:hypothetical protein SASPL_148050 [Salvia splendens]